MFIKRDKLFWKTFSLVSLWFFVAFLVATFIFPAGIYSCRDAAALDLDPKVNSIEYDKSVKVCLIKQDIGTVIAAVHFLPAIIAGFATNQGSGFISPDLIGPATFFVGAVPVLLIEIYGISYFIYQMRSRKK